MSILVFLAHAYVWCDPDKPQTILIQKIAVPLVRMAEVLSVPPVLSYATYNLLNWHHIHEGDEQDDDIQEQPMLGRIYSISNFNGGRDEMWFRCVHIAIEATCGPALARLIEMQMAAQMKDKKIVIEILNLISLKLQST